jgi:hypothetical protein
VRAESEPPSNIQWMNPGILRKDHRRYDSESHNLSGHVEIEDQSNVNQDFSVCENDSPFEFVDLRSMKIKHTPVMFRWISGRNQTFNPWKFHGNKIPSWITPPRGDTVLPQFQESWGCVVENRKVVPKINEKAKGLWGKNLNQVYCGLITPNRLFCPSLQTLNHLLAALPLCSPQNHKSKGLLGISGGNLRDLMLVW